jgi:membrane fusion protein (multidrug efflux system)
VSEIKPDTTPSVTPGKRRRVMMIIAAIFLLLGSLLFLRWLLVSRYYEDTDNAYVQGNVVQVTPQIAGTVTKIHVDDTDLVKAGQLLVSLDPADTRVAVAQAEAQLAQTVREVRTLYTSHRQSDANLAQRQVELTRAEDDLVQRKKQAEAGTISKEDLRHAEAAVNAARAAVNAAREQASSGQALIDGIGVRSHPNVKRAAAGLTEALLAQQRVNPGTPLMAVIPLDRLWVDANFKEGQLRDMRVGQSVSLVSDLYGSAVKYDGKVIGMGAGTGSAFALLPAQNATGNWIKVVQRVPVRIAIDRQQLQEHPLRIGLSMSAVVDLHNQQGSPLGTLKESSDFSLDIPPDTQIQSRIDAIINANLK